MDAPLPNQIQHHPIGGEMKHLFTKNMTQDDMLSLVLVGDSKNFLTSLPKPMLDEISIKGLEIEIYTPRNKIWATIYYDRTIKIFRLEKIAWAEVFVKSDFKVGDKIACWSLYHADLGPNGILALLIEKVHIDIDNEGSGQQARAENVGDGNPSLYDLYPDIDYSEPIDRSSMAPTRKKSVNKRFLNEASPEKEVKSSGKSKQQPNGKKKLSDKLGPQWKKAELERFYKAYRDNGKNWKKVAAEVRNRSVEMVEALYNMNRAYLSLPEGTASVVGLIAMMIDHYSVLEASDSERESNEIPGVPRKLQKRKRPKVLLSASKEEPLHSSMVGSTDGCLSLLERGFGRPLHAVGKRTPRFPVSYLRKKEDGENYVSPKKKRRKSEINANEHSAVLALTEALQRVDSPQMSQTPRRRTENMKSSPVQSWDRMSESSPANLRDAFINENWSESGIGCGGADLARVRDASSLAELEGIGTVEVHKKGKKFYGNKIRVEKNGNSQSDDGGEACSGTEEEQKFSTLKGKVEIEMPNAKIDETSHWGQRKRSKKIFSDGNSVLSHLILSVMDWQIIFPFQGRELYSHLIACFV
ncbi:PROTEIN ALWAYS EARLY 1-RELATED [Salix purpurea]|uniref:PROTEIN ALWAYS EARLY 1-RELATED n=1 Tax=Salix purpurea TaxID=77065 RepID=A0A9Q0WZW7_SALPP|nr:PROTEIN ALWAYS EARLY 1-RELATED [Salix purpurea]